MITKQIGEFFKKFLLSHEMSFIEPEGYFMGRDRHYIDFHCRDCGGEFRIYEEFPQHQAQPCIYCLSYKLTLDAYGIECPGSLLQPRMVTVIGKESLGLENPFWFEGWDWDLRVERVGL